MDYNLDLDFLFNNEKEYKPLHQDFEVEMETKADLESFADRDWKNRNTIDKQTDDSYYFICTFQNKQQRNDFLEVLKWGEFLEDNYFINGLKLSKFLGIKQNYINLSKKKFNKSSGLNIIGG